MVGIRCTVGGRRAAMKRRWRGLRTSGRRGAGFGAQKLVRLVRHLCRCRGALGRQEGAEGVEGDPLGIWRRGKSPLTGEQRAGHSGRALEHGISRYSADEPHTVHTPVSPLVVSRATGEAPPASPRARQAASAALDALSLARAGPRCYDSIHLPPPPQVRGDVFESPAAAGPHQPPAACATAPRPRRSHRAPSPLPSHRSSQVACSIISRPLHQGRVHSQFLPHHEHPARRDAASACGERSATAGLRIAMARPGTLKTLRRRPRPRLPPCELDR